MDKRFKKIIIWGHPLNTHTHSFIHAAFYKAFKSIGYDVYWLNDNSNVSGFDFRDCLFLTEGQVDSNIPLVKDSYYILHNCSVKRYLDSGCKCLILQVFGKDCIQKPQSIKINEYTVIEKGNDVDCLYTCWATDLLPTEIKLEDASNRALGNCIWIGTKGGGSTLFENWTNLDPFFLECTRSGISTNFIDPWVRPVSFADNRKIVNESYLAPAIQGKWQVDYGYIPCRIFKHISYGHFGYTNSLTVYEIFDAPMVYSSDPLELFRLAINKKNDPNHIKELKDLMNEVKNKHTYINRIETIIKYLPD